MQKIDSTVRAKILSEALPYMQMYNKKYIVVKYGGHAMVNSNLAEKFAQNIVMLQHAGMYPIVVHGGRYCCDVRLNKSHQHWKIVLIIAL